MKTVLSAVVTVVLVLVGVYFIIPRNPAITPLSGVGVDEAYQGTTTPQVADEANLCVRPSNQTQRQTGVLGTVNILNANTSAFTIYDATTTNILARLGNIATSSLILAEFPGSPTEGTYVFDIQAKNGILVDYVTAATVSTSTITFRCQG